MENKFKKLLRKAGPKLMIAIVAIPLLTAVMTFSGAPQKIKETISYEVPLTALADSNPVTVENWTTSATASANGSAEGSNWTALGIPATCEASFTTTTYIYFGGAMLTAINAGRISASINLSINASGSVGGSSTTRNDWSSRYSVTGCGFNQQNIGVAEGYSTPSIPSRLLSSGTVSISLYVYTKARCTAFAASFNAYASGSVSATINFTISKWTIPFRMNPASGAGMLKMGASAPSTAYDAILSPDTSTTATVSVDSINENYYFTGWTSSPNYGSAATRSITTADASAFVLNQPTYTANFDTFPALNVASLPYNRSQQGTNITVPSGYTATYAYSPAPLAGDTMPRNAGTYSVTVTMLRNTTGEIVGTKTFTNGFVISPATFTFTTDAKNYIYGQKLEDVAPTVVTAQIGGIAVEGTATWAGPTTYPPLGPSQQPVHFTPSSANFVTPANVNCAVTTTVGATFGILATGPGYSGNVAAFDPATSVISGGHAILGLKITENLEQNFFFVGWQRGLSGTYTYISTSKNFTIDLYNEPASSRTCVYRAVLVQFTVNGQNSKNITTSYTGNPVLLTLSQNYAALGQPGTLEQTAPTSYEGSGAGQYRIGTINATFTYTFKTGSLAWLDYSPTIVMTLTQGVLNVVGASTGWVTSASYDLSVFNSTQDAVEKYIYSTDGGANWTDDPLNPLIPSPAAGNLLSFIVSAEGAHVTMSKTYIFKAVHSLNGAPGDPQHAVATSGPIICKIDSITPELTISGSAEGAYNWDWINKTVTVNLLAKYGGSMAQISWSDDGINWTNTQLISFNTTDEDMHDETTFHMTFAQETNVVKYFKINSGTGAEVFVVDEYGVNKPYYIKIDKTAPQIRETGRDFVVNENGWMGREATFAYTVTDNVGWSGVSDIEAGLESEHRLSYTLNGTDDSLESLDFYNNNFLVKLRDYIVYTIRITDRAGNTTSITLHEKVDTATPELTVDFGSYVKDVWVKGAAVIDFTINSGASETAILYSKDGSGYLPLTSGFISGTVGADAKQIVHSQKSFGDEQDSYYKFKAVSAAGIYSDEFDFGRIKVDNTAPTINVTDPEWSTDLSHWTGSNWSEFNIENVKFRVYEGATYNSGMASVKINNDVYTNDSSGTDRYKFTIESSINYVVTATDLVGNVRTYTFHANVDTNTPSYTKTAYIGNTSAIYDFGPTEWISPANNGANAFVRLEFDLDISPSGGKVDFLIETAPDQWVIAKPGVLVWQAGRETETHQTAHLTIIINSEYNNACKFVMTSGSGKTYAGDIVVGTIRIDLNAPSYSTPLSYTDGFQTITEAALQSAWRYNTVTASFNIQDSPSGLDVLEIRRYPVGAVIGTDPYDIVATSGSSPKTFLMDRYNQYVVYRRDLAGNEASTALLPRIDLTDGFSFTVDTGDFVSGTWLTQIYQNVQFLFPVVFAPGSGYTNFGPSGGSIQMSVDGGQTWAESITINGVPQAIQNNGTLNPSMTASVSQQKTYSFRLINGAGRVYYYPSTVTVKKDIVTPAISATATVNGVAYTDGETHWVNTTVLFNVVMTVGASLADYYCGISEIQGLPESALEWTKVNASLLPETVSAPLRTTYSTSYTQSKKLYYYFRIVAGTGVSVYTSAGIPVAIDTTPPSAVARAYYQGAAYSGNFASGNVEIRLENFIKGPSGATVQYRSRRIGAATYGAYTGAGYDAIENKLIVSGNAYDEYLFRITGGSGVVFETTQPVAIKIDVVVPAFTLSISGDQLPAGSLSAGWYTTNVIITFNVTVFGESAYTAQYMASADGETYGQWTELPGGTAVYNDPTTEGGTTRYLKFRLISGSGVPSAVNDLGALKIDDNIYSIRATQKVGTVTGTYSSISNQTYAYRRGDTAHSDLIAASGYYVKSYSITSSGSDTVTRTYTAASRTTSENFTKEITGANITIEAEFYKVITVTFNGLAQYLKGGSSAAPVGVNVTETGFGSIYGSPKFDVTYGGSENVPAEIGVYQVAASLEGVYKGDIKIGSEYFIVNYPAPENGVMTLLYFEGSGTETSPYLVSTETDLKYIEKYMDPDPGYDFLGAGRRSAYFLQDRDIVLSPLFTPISGAFTGTYDGGNKKIVYGGTFDAGQNFGIFRHIGYILDPEHPENNPTTMSFSFVMNLGLEFNLTAGASSENVGFLASTAYYAVINGVYAVGDLTINGGSGKYGGLVGSAELSVFTYNFTDVYIRGYNVTGYAGGAVGYLIDGGFVSNVSIGQLVLTNSLAAKYGSMMGFAAGTFSSDAPGYPYNYYVKGNLSVNNNLVPNSNIADYGSLAFYNQINMVATAFIAAGFDDFIASDLVIGDGSKAGWQSRTVSNLSKIRIIKAGAAGLGTESSPFLVSAKASLFLLDVFPYAYFRQTADIGVGNFSGVAYDRVFSGVYDGDNFTLAEITIDKNTEYGGFIALLSGTVKNLKLANVFYTITSSAETSYAGGISAIIYAGGKLINDIVSGSITVYNTNPAGKLYAGGLAGSVRSGIVSDCISLVDLAVVNVYSVNAGGIVGWVSGTSILNSVVSLARVSVTFISGGCVGSTFGYVSDDSVTGTNIYNVGGNTYANGKPFETSIGDNGSPIGLKSVATNDYPGTVGAGSHITVNGSGVLALISALYPFSGGSGTPQDPFLVSTYTQLLRIGSYMYASFRLTNNIVIGDFNSDGTVDSDYAYDFRPIGGNAVFTGSLDGEYNRPNPGGGYTKIQSSIGVLTDALFETIGGSVKNLKLNVNYRAFDEGNPALAAYPGSHSLAKGESIVYGPVARISRSGATINNVIVNGEVEVRTSGQARAKIGGIVGVAKGGAIQASISNVGIAVRAYAADVGGVAGTVEGNVQIQGSILMTINLTFKDVYVDGGIVNAGLIVGAQTSANANIDKTTYTNAKVFIGGIEQTDILKSKIGFGG
jgi:hypothetical protein